MPQLRLHRILSILFALLALPALGCDGTPADPSDAGTTDAQSVDAGALDATSVEDATTPATCATVAPEVVTFTTDDGVRLEADLYRAGTTAGASGRTLAVLLHMIPPSNDRHNYPTDFIDALVTRCVDVLNVDRRGAGGSEGIATEAYTGPNGALDAKAAFAYALALPDGPDASHIALVGASNGTTTLVDYVAAASADPSLVTPRAVVLLSGGTYTENQNDVSALSALRALFVYPTAEAAWNDSVAADAAATWAFQAYDPGRHGTGVFTANPESIEAVVAFLAL